MKKRLSITKAAAEGLAIQALTFIAGDGERLGGFLAATGIGPAEIRAVAREPGFMAGVLEYLAANAGLLKEFLSETGVKAADIAAARTALGDKPWERDLP
jgi:hypothetical protein